jgi:hypothetical protein
VFGEQERESGEVISEHDREYIDVLGRDLGMEETRRGQKENDDVSEHDREYIDVLGKDLGMEETRRGGESAKKIFERGAGRNAWEEYKRNRMTVKAGKRAAKFEDKMDGR